MTAITGNYPSDNSTLANYKAWGQAISNAFSTLGWVQTADTGQINWSTVAVPGGNYNQYEIWKANDSLAATFPIYVKIAYGYSSTQPAIQVTVGQGSNGSGTITGNIWLSGAYQITNNNSNQGSTTYPCWFSGSAGEFRMWMWGVSNATPNIGVLFGIERSKDSSGNNTGTYVTVYTANQNAWNSARQQTITLTGLANIEGGVITPTFTAQSGTGAAFGTVAAMPCFPTLGLLGNPMLGIVTVAQNDAGSNSTITVASMYGSTHTYLVCGSLQGPAGTRNYNATNMNIAMRYE